jgi:hypothetical protein
LFTQPAAGDALTDGVASATDSVSLAGDAVAVAPKDIAVGFSDIAGTTGDVYSPAVDESPEPPARWIAGAASTLRTMIAPNANIPAMAESLLVCTPLMVRPPVGIDDTTVVDLCQRSYASFILTGNGSDRHLRKRQAEAQTTG